MVKKQSKTRRKNKALSERRLIYENLKEYNHLISIGYNKEQAIKKLKNKPKGSSVDKLKQRVKQTKDQFGVTAISLKGIRITKPVLDYIKKLEKTDVIEHYIDGHDILKLKNPKFWEPKK